MMHAHRFLVVSFFVYHLCFQVALASPVANELGDSQYVTTVLDTLSPEQKAALKEKYPDFEFKSEREQKELLEKYVKEITARDPTYCDEHPEVVPPCNLFR